MGKTSIATLFTAIVLALGAYVPKASAGAPQPTKIARISKAVFGANWRVAACIAHYESTDGKNLFNGPNVGPWQINTSAHRWVNAGRLVHDWWYSARVAFVISDGGKNWGPWTTHSLCGV